MQDSDRPDPEQTTGRSPAAVDARPTARADLLWRLLVFQLKLMMDGFRDIALIPISLIAGLIGIVRGGPQADAPFQEVLRFGRRTEVWINLFGHQEGETADKLIEPLQKKVFAELNNNPQLQEVGSNIGRHLDKVGRQRPRAVEPQNENSGDAPG